MAEVRRRWGRGTAPALEGFSRTALSPSFLLTVCLVLHMPASGDTEPQGRLVQRQGQKVSGRGKGKNKVGWPYQASQAQMRDGESCPVDGPASANPGHACSDCDGGRTHAESRWPATRSHVEMSRSWKIRDGRQFPLDAQRVLLVWLGGCLVFPRPSADEDGDRYLHLRMSNSITASPSCASTVTPRGCPARSLGRRKMKRA